MNVLEHILFAGMENDVSDLYTREREREREKERERERERERESLFSI